MPNTATDLVNFAAIEAGTDNIGPNDVRQYTEWLQFKLDSIVTKNHYLWTYRIVKVADVQEISVGDTGYKYAYQFSDSILDVLLINLESVSPTGDVPSIDYAINHNIPFDINQFIPGAVRESRPSFLFSNKVLYTQAPLEDSIVKVQPSVAEAPEDFQEMLQLYLTSVLMVRQSGPSGASFGYKKEAMSLEASIVARRLSPTNLQQGVIYNYLRQIFSIVNSV